MKIICVGMNYASHNKEMQHTPMNQQEPVVFMKPDSALLKDGKPFFIPDFSTQIHYETEIVVRISRLGKNIAPRFASRYYDEITVGIDFTARDLQNKLRKEGMPWEICKGFDYSAVIGEFILLHSLEKEISQLSYCLHINDIKVQEGETSCMIFSVDEIVAYASRFFTLKIGDLIFTGTPAGVGPVKINDHLQGYLEGQKLLDFHVK